MLFNFILLLFVSFNSIPLISFQRYVTVNYRHSNGDNKHLSFIPDYHRSYDPLQYPLIFPCGQDGWSENSKHTCLQHANIQLMDRNDKHGFRVINPTICAKSLSQQYLVDQFCKVELSRLNFVQNNQRKLRADVYNKFKDATKADDQDITKIGKKVILPSSFLSGDRFMHQNYQDAIGLLQRFGKPHLFITMTTNPDWNEIQEQLKPGETALDRPDIVGRVFKLKKQQLIRDIEKEMIFGKIVARTHTIEFQKRGYPHVHLIIWLADKAHMTPNKIDHIICAEIPDEKVAVIKEDKSGNFHECLESNPLYDLVTSMMLHGPCGPMYPNKSCMRDGHCCYGYRKHYQSETQLDKDAYPVYCCRAPEEEGNIFTKFIRGNEHKFTNGDVVPYNKYLLFKYKCHINVECVNSVHAIKYLFKYILKGNDSATIKIGASIDDNTSNDTSNGNMETTKNEVEEFQNKRYVSAAEAAWRLRSNEICEQSPPIIRLQIHLPGEQIVYFDANKKNQSSEVIERNARTKLTAYFELCSTDEFAQSKFYRHIPEHYTWDTSQRKWNRRKRNTQQSGIPNAVGRIYSISPIQIKLYSLRLLLTHVCGPKSFEHIRTVDGIVYDTFQAAAIARNLVKDDKIWIDCMNEANEHQTNIHLLRKLFVTILLHCEVSNHKAFLLHCKDMLTVDLVHKYKNAFQDNEILNRFIESDTKGNNDVNKNDIDRQFQYHFGHFDDEDDDDWSLEKLL